MIHIHNMNSQDELKMVKRDMTIIVKENNKLKKELIEKNTIINSIINQNVTEIKTIKDKYDEIIKGMTETYNINISCMNKTYDTYRSGLHKRLKDTIATHYKLNNEKYELQFNHNKELINKINSHTDKIDTKNNVIDDLRHELELLTQTKLSLESQLNESTYIKNISETQLKELLSIHNNCTNIISSDEKIIHDLRNTITDLTSQLDLSNTKLSQVVSDIDSLKIINKDVQHKYGSLINELINKQNSLDEKTLEILNLTTNCNEIEEKLVLLYSDKKELSVKTVEYINKIDNLNMEILTLNRATNQLTIEKENALYEKQHYVKEYEITKLALRKMETEMLDKMRNIQENFEKDKKKYLEEQISKNQENISELNIKTLSIQEEHNAYVQSKEQQIKSLMDHIKSFTDNQYVLFNEMEKLKSSNDKLREDQTEIDQILTKIHTEYKKQLDDMMNTYTKEKDALIENYKDTIKKTQETNITLEERLSQTVEALSLSRTTIANMRDTNIAFEKQLQSREAEDLSILDKYNNSKSEIISLKEKLDRSIDINNTYGTKEKQYELQLKQLQAKYNHLLILTKKNINQNQLLNNIQ